MSWPGLSGLEMLERFIAGEIEHPMATTLNFRPVEAAVGVVVWEGRPDERHLSSRRTIHGGYLAAFLDSVTGSAIASHLPEGVDFVTVDLAVKMIRPVTPGAVLRAEGRSLSVSRHMGTSAATVHDENGTLISEA